jgi:hypothetical protein
MLAAGRPMAPDAPCPYPSRDVIYPTTPSLCYSFPTALFSTPPISPSLCCSLAGHGRILWRDVTPGRCTAEELLRGGKAVAGPAR